MCLYDILYDLFIIIRQSRVERRPDCMAKRGCRKCIASAHDFYLWFSDGTSGAARKDHVSVSDVSQGTQNLYLWFILF